MNLLKIGTLLSAGVILAGCASSPPFVRDTAAHEDKGVYISRHYVPVYYTPYAQWGEEHFVAGYARQGVVVTPSRVWTYGQGRGFRAQYDRNINQMTDWDAHPCSTIGPIPDGALRALGAAYINMSRTQVYNQPFSAAEQHKLIEFHQSGCSEAYAVNHVRAQRWDAVLRARQVANEVSPPAPASSAQAPRVQPAPSGQPICAPNPMNSDGSNAAAATVAASKEPIRSASTGHVSSYSAGDMPDGAAQTSSEIGQTQPLHIQAKPSVKNLSCGCDKNMNYGKSASVDEQGPCASRANVDDPINEGTWDYQGQYNG